jgi:hypothetical protein
MLIYSAGESAQLGMLVRGVSPLVSGVRMGEGPVAHLQQNFTCAKIVASRNKRTICANTQHSTLRSGRIIAEPEV